MRVLFFNDLCDPRIGSSIRLMYQLAAWLRARGHETLVLSATQDPEEVGELEIEGTRVVRVLSDYPVRFRAWVALDNPRVRKTVDRILAEYRPDVVHSHLIHSHIGFRSLTAAREAGAAVVFTAHDVMTFCYQKLTCFHGGEAEGGLLRDYRARASKCIPCQRLRFRPGRNRAIRKVLARDVHRLTTVSDELGRVLRANDIEVHATVWNGLRAQEQLPSPEEVRAFRSKIGLGDELLIAIGGRLHEQKGVGQLLRAMGRLAEAHPDLRLLVLGKRDVYDSDFAGLAAELGLAERVVTPGWLDGRELASAYAAVDVFVTPSICFDTFGMVNLEAMEHGRPVVATTFGGSPEVVLDGETGLIVNPFDLDALARALGRLLADPDLRQRMGSLGQRRLHEKFMIERVGEEYLEQYTLAQRAAGRST